MGESGMIDWVNSRLKAAEVKDMSEGFCDGTVLMELVVLLLRPHNKKAVLEALEKFIDTPTTMTHSLSNIKSVLTCLTADGTHIDVEPLDIFSGDQQCMKKVLETLRNTYDQTNPDKTSSSTCTGQDTIPNMASTNTKQDNIKVDMATQTQQDIVAGAGNADHAAVAIITVDQSIGIKIKDSDSLETLHNKLNDQTNPNKTSSTSTEQDIIPDMSTDSDTKQDNIKVDTATHAQQNIIASNLRPHLYHAAAPFITKNERIIVMIKDNDPLCVDKKRLTKDSRVFRQFIDELHFYELEMDDFEADTVGLFLTLLEDRQVDNIQDGQFRELHKMSVVFEVEWLRQECCNRLSSRMKKDMEDNEKLFVFEECLFIFRKFEQNDMMGALIAELASVDNSLFITKYFQEFEKLDSVQLELMLKLGGSNSELFLQTVLQNLISKNKLGENIKFLLQRMNLALCSEANNELYNTVFDTISNLPNISVADMKFVLQLTTETTKLVILRREKRSNKRGTRLLFDENNFKELRENCKTLKDITDAISNNQVTSMLLIDLLLEVFYDNPPNTEEMETLADMCRSKGVQKISHQYLDMIISAVENCPLQQKERLIQLLDMIKKNEKLSSCNHNVMITRDRYIVLSSGTEYKHCYTFKHPCYTNCSMPDSKCGFVLNYCQRDNNWRIELCVDEEDYVDTGIHYHDSISAQDMCPYSMFSGTVGPDKVISAPAIWWPWWEKWLPNSEWMITQRCSAFDVSDYLIAK